MSTQYRPFATKNFVGGTFSRETRAALVIAHPGHELCWMGWVKQARPSVFILTDGSGSDDQSRLELTTELLTRLGAPRGGFYGRLTDAQVYRAILSGDAGTFCAIAAELAMIFARERFDYVACEAAEGYNPTHDLSRVITGAAIARANRTSDHHTLGYEIDLIQRRCSQEDAPQTDSVWLRLDDETLAEKTRTMRGHPHLQDEVSAGLDGLDIPEFREFPELAAELQSRVDEMGPESFRIEHLRRMKDEISLMTEGVPFYERYGEMLVRSGRYTRAIRYAEHIAPIVEGLRRFAEGD